MRSVLSKGMVHVLSEALSAPQFSFERLILSFEICEFNHFLVTKGVMWGDLTASICVSTDGDVISVAQLVSP